MQSEAPGQTQGPAGVPLPLSSDEDDESMDFSNSRKRLWEDSGDEDDHAPRKLTATTPSESSDEESHASQGSEEMSGSECRTTVDSEGVSTTADMTSSATTGGPDPASSDGAGTCQLPTTASTTTLPHTEGLPLQAASPQGVESTLPAPAAEGTTESHGNLPSDASAAMDVVEEVLTSTATGGNTRKEAPYTAEDFLLTSSAGATPTNRRKKGKKKPTKKQPRLLHRRAQLPTSPNLSARPPLQWTPQGSTAVQRGVPPDTEGFQVVTTRRARRRARDLAAAAALPVDPAIVGTVPFQPSAPGDTFSGSPRLILAQALSARLGVAAVRVNQKRNIVAADATTRECLQQLLTIKELKGIPVTAKEPADHKISTGFLHGVDGEPAADSLSSGIQSAVPVLSAAREGRTVTLRFAGPVPPEHVSLFLVHFPVRPARPRPLQCRQCGRFGHVKESCSCIRCGQTHPGENCKQTRPRCVNCGGPHSADTPECPPVAGAAEGCHYHGIFPNHPLEACSGSGGARGDSGGADLCKRGEGPPFAAPPPLRQDPSRRLANLVASHSRDSSPLALLPLWPCRRPLLFLRPRLLQLPLSWPSLQLLSPGGRPAVPMAPVAPPAATVALPPADPAYQILATLRARRTFANKEKPDSSCRAFFPTHRDISNQIQALLKKDRFSTVDQENARILIEKIRGEQPEFSVVYWPYAARSFMGSSDSDNVEEGIASECEDTLLFCFITKFMRSMLKKYGGSVVCLDATHKMSDYALPLFLLVVKTQSEYTPAGVFIIQFETAHCNAKKITTNSASRVMPSNGGDRVTEATRGRRKTLLISSVGCTYGGVHA
ncbi:hypothetical protein MRX96_052386 [Rhipicephalus microplus]